MNVNKSQLIQCLKAQSISIGILASDWLKLPDTLATLSAQQHYLLHFDIGDGQFSPFFTVGAIAVKQFPSPFIKDVHLMVKDPFNVAKDCAKAGADIITLQIEQSETLATTIDYLATHYPECLIGLALCPETELVSLIPYLNKIDLIQVLTLDPRTGIKAEQQYIVERIGALIEMLKETGAEKFIAVDGSMNLPLAAQLYPLGIDWVVSGSALFSHDDLQQTLLQWKTAFIHN
ncbi:MAG: ribulose phosphate epimerase [Pasteurella oralis]|uniref:ribulose phosphate epimerase n=1 Tax=Pasteurella oralis TaxID=1071947 RepID=UPI0026FF89F1|nr:ribulose phosphate epimerase [Pasteurella oralis]